MLHMKMSNEMRLPQLNECGDSAGLELKYIENSIPSDLKV